MKENTEMISSKRRIAVGWSSVALALVTLSSGYAVTAAPQTGAKRKVQMAPKLPQVEFPEGALVLPLLDWGNRPIVELTINGTGPHRFILDTGAMTTVIDIGLAEEISLPEVGTDELKSPVADEPMLVPRVSMMKATLGGIIINDLGASVMNLAGMFGSEDAPRGVLSARVFSGALLVIDYPNERIVVRAGELGPSDGARIFQYDESDGFPSLTLSVAGTEIKAHLDTGSPATFSLPGEYMKSLPLESEPIHRGTARLVDTEVKLYGAMLDGSIQVGEYTFEKPDITFGEGLPAGNVGYGFLSRFSVTLDMKNKRVQLDGEAVMTAASTAGTPTMVRRMQLGASSRKVYGVMFPGIDGDPLVINGVGEGSVAEAAGLQAGDIVLAMNEEKVSELSSQERISMLRASPLILEFERDGEKLSVKMEL
jgi:hypothetical protein